MTDYIESNIQSIIKSLLDRPSIVLSGEHVHLYLKDVSTSFRDYLVDR